MWTKNEIILSGRGWNKCDRIRCESRQTGHIRIINKSGRHKAQSIILKDNGLV